MASCTLLDASGPARRPLGVASALFCGGLLMGCGSLPQPWKKGVLAKPAMSFDNDQLGARFDEHIFASKEAALGRGGVGGAGCGCD